MSNQIYEKTHPFAHSRNTNVNFNYVWDASSQYWVPEETSSINLNYVFYYF